MGPGPEPIPARPGDDAGAPDVFDRLPWRERVFIGDVLRQETVGGALLLLAALIALIWANSPWRDTYYELASTKVGPAALNLNLSLSTWAADGLLAIFFYVAGLELKRELVVGTLRKPSEAVLPVAAALGGMIVPALLFVAVTWGSSPDVTGWGIPMATDIAFALAVLAVVGRNLPAQLRAFLLTLAVVDDLGAITVIALFYSDKTQVGWLALAIGLLALYAYLQHRRVRSPWIYIPLALTTWAVMHESGIHATVAGVALGLLTRVRPDPGEDASPAERLEHAVRPWSAAIAVPIFAFFSAGVTVVGTDLAAVVRDPAAQGIVLGLVVGKFIGVFFTTYLVVRFTRARLSSALAWSDIAGVAAVAGVGFTVSLLIAELAFDTDATQLAHAKLGILSASVIAALLASVLLLRRNRVYRELAAVEDRDDDGDGIPDVYQRDNGGTP
jgi:NhaA family Na+:H+ antiporter